MVAAKSKARKYDGEQQSSRKRQCNRGTTAACHDGDAAAEFLQRFDLSQGNPSPEQPVAQWAWRCFAEFNVRRSAACGRPPDHAAAQLCCARFLTMLLLRGAGVPVQVLMRQHAGKLRDIPLCGYLSLSRAAKPAVFARLLEAEVCPANW